MSAGSTFASQQKALRRQFDYSDDYPLVTMIKELNTQILSRVGTGTLSEQLDRRRRRRDERARTAESRVRFLGCRWAKASFLTRKSGTGGPHFLTLRFLNARCQLYARRRLSLSLSPLQRKPPPKSPLHPPSPALLPDREGGKHLMECWGRAVHPRRGAATRRGGTSRTCRRFRSAARS